MEYINKLFKEIEIEKIKKNLECVIRLIEEQDRKEQNKILKEIVRTAIKKKQELAKEYKVCNGVCFFNERIAPIALLADEIAIDSENNEDILESLKFILNNYFKQFEKNKVNDSFIEIKTMEKLVNVLEAECKFFSILERKKIELNMFYFSYQYKNIDIQQINFNEIKNDKFAIHIFNSYQEEKEPDKLVELFLRQFGFILKNILVGASKKAPEDFFDIYEPVKEITYIDKESKEYTALFADTFAHYIIEKMEIRIKKEYGEKWSPKPDGTNKEFVKNVLSYFDNIFIKLQREKEIEEWNDEDSCPCGSNKKYKDCCKKKRIKYYKEDDNHYTKAVPMHPEMKKILYKKANKFRQLFGRTPGKEEYVYNDVLLKDITRMNKILKRKNFIDRAWLYASNQMDGLMVTEENKDLLPERDINEFASYMAEYKKIMKSKVRGKSCNLLQAAEGINIVLEDMMDKRIDDMIYVLKIFVNSYSREKAKEKIFIMEDIKDFLVYCAYKTTIHMTSLKELVAGEYYDTSMAVVRFIYEILIQIRAYKKDSKLFEQKILSLAGLDSGKYVRENRNSIKNLETGEIYNYGIKKKELAEKAGKNYEQLYDTLYRELSGFIHLDAIGAKKIFQENDLFLDIDECLMAGFMGSVFCIEIIMELIDFEDNDERISKDIKYFSNMVLKEILDIFPMIIEIENNEAYKILEHTLKEYKTDYKINYQRKNKCEVL